MRYDEQLGWSPAAGWALLAVIVVLMTIAVVQPDDGDGSALLPVLAVIALPVGLAMLFRRLHITLDATTLSVGFGPFRNRLPRERIVACKATTYRWWEYGGWGIRSNLRHPRQRVTLYNVMGDGGQAVQVILDDGRRVLVSSRDPAAVCAALGRDG